MKTKPEQNIYWKDIKKTDTVIETKTIYMVIKKNGSKCGVYWLEEEAGTAQTWLRNQTIIRKSLKNKE